MNDIILITEQICGYQGQSYNLWKSPQWMCPALDMQANPFKYQKHIDLFFSLLFYMTFSAWMPLSFTPLIWLCLGHQALQNLDNSGVPICASVGGLDLQCLGRSRSVALIQSCVNIWVSTVVQRVSWTNVQRWKVTAAPFFVITYTVYTRMLLYLVTTHMHNMDSSIFTNALTQMGTWLWYCK